MNIKYYIFPSKVFFSISLYVLQLYVKIIITNIMVMSSNFKTALYCCDYLYKTKHNF